MTTSVCEYNNNINIYVSLILFNFVSLIGFIIYIYNYFNYQLQLTNKETQQQIQNNLDNMLQNLNDSKKILYENMNNIIETNNNHMLIGYGYSGFSPIIIPKNIIKTGDSHKELERGYLFHNTQIIYYIKNAYIILPYIYKTNIRNLDLFECLACQALCWSFIDENHNLILPSFNHVPSETTKQQYINQFRKQINEVMEKYPDLFVHIN
jgi:hypothetical protein